MNQTDALKYLSVIKCQGNKSDDIPPMNQHEPTITHLKVFVTYDCNLCCQHCVQARIAKQVQPIGRSLFMTHLDTFLASAKTHNPNMKIYLSGGEPLLSPRFFQAAHIIKQLNLTYKTITNGLLLERQLPSLLDAKPASIWVTFNGTGSRHDAVVGLKGGFERVKNAVTNSIARLKQANIHVGANLVMNVLTYDRVSEDVDVIAALGFDEIVLQHLSFLPDHVIKDHQEQYVEHFGYKSTFCFGEGVEVPMIDPYKLYQQLQTVLEKDYPFKLIIFPCIKELDDLIDYYGNTPSHWQTKRCVRALRELWVQPDGSVSVCFAHHVGTIRQSIDQILQAEEFIQWQAQLTKLTQPLQGCMRCHRLYM